MIFFIEEGEAVDLHWHLDVFSYSEIHPQGFHRYSNSFKGTVALANYILKVVLMDRHSTSMTSAVQYWVFKRS